MGLKWRGGREALYKYTYICINMHVYMWNSSNYRKRDHGSEMERRKGGILGRKGSLGKM